MVCLFMYISMSDDGGEGRKRAGDEYDMNRDAERIAALFVHKWCMRRCVELWKMVGM